MRFRNLFAATAAVACTCAFPALADAAGRTFFVSPKGKDTATGRSRSAALRTVGRALAKARAGDDVQLAAGTYGSFTMGRSGVQGQPITVEAASGAKVIVRPGANDKSGVIISAGVGYVVVRGIQVSGVHHFGGGVAGFLVGDGAHDVLLDRVRAIDNWIYGIEVRTGTRVRIDHATIQHNAVGIRFIRGGAGSVVAYSNISNNDQMAINDAAGGNDFGANGVVFQWTTGPITAVSNVLVGNIAPSHDYRYDGSAFETFGGSGIRMLGNRIANNPTAFETGTDGPPCDNVIFARNRVYGTFSAASRAAGKSVRGIILRCGRNVLIANNTFHRMDDWVFWFDGVDQNAGPFGSTRILGNAYLQPTHDAVYAIDMGATQLGGVTVDGNAMGWEGGTGWPGKLQGHGGLRTYAELQRYAGFDVHGRQGDLRFANAAAHDYHLQAGSAAIDLAPRISGVSATGYAGAAPDSGVYEYRG